MLCNNTYHGTWHITGAGSNYFPSVMGSGKVDD